MARDLTITIELNRQAILHVLRYIKGIYLTRHVEDGEWYEIEQCPYCITLLVQLNKAKYDIALKEKIEELRIRAGKRMKGYSLTKARAPLGQRET